MSHSSYYLFDAKRKLQTSAGLGGGVGLKGVEWGGGKGWDDAFAHSIASTGGQ